MIIISNILDLNDFYPHMDVVFVCDCLFYKAYIMACQSLSQIATAKEDQITKMKQIIPSVYWHTTTFSNMSLSHHNIPVDKNKSGDNLQSASPYGVYFEIMIIWLYISPLIRPLLII